MAQDTAPQQSAALTPFQLLGRLLRLVIKVIFALVMLFILSWPLGATAEKKEARVAMQEAGYPVSLRAELLSFEVYPGIDPIFGRDEVGEVCPFYTGRAFVYEVGDTWIVYCGYLGGGKVAEMNAPDDS